MFKSILCPVDFSEFTRSQINFARTFANSQKANLTAIHIVPTPVPIYEVDFWYSADRLAQLARETMKDYAAAGVESIVVTATSVEKRILEEAKKHDLIIMPTHGFHGLQKFFLGSVFQGVLLRSHIPVLALPPKFLQQPAPEFRKPAAILCAIDLQQGSSKLIEYTEKIAEEYGATFSVLHSIDLKKELLRHLSAESIEQARSDVKSKIVEQYPFSERDGRLIVAKGPAYESIPASAEQNVVDLLILGFSHKSQTRLRTTLYRTVIQLSIPVLCVPVD